MTYELYDLVGQSPQNDSNYTLINQTRVPGWGPGAAGAGPAGF